MYSKTIRPCGVFSCMPSVVGVSALDAEAAQACMVQTSVLWMKVERAAVARASLNFLGYDANSFSPYLQKFLYPVADTGAIGFELRLLEDNFSHRGRQTAKRTNPRYLGHVVGTTVPPERTICSD